jgi:rRNA maturation RNase YbeY
VSLSLSITAETGRAFVPFLRTNVKRAHVALKRRLAPRRTLPLVELSLALVGDRRMSALHAQFMGVAGPTDVLTFPIDEDARGKVLTGEVIVCVAEAIRQARARRIPPREELLLYAIHGMLHLSGYDDRNDRAYRAMHRMEDAILSDLGFGPVFAAKPVRAKRRTPAGASR